MRAFATFEVADPDRSRRWYVDAVGFQVLADLPGPDGATVLLHLRRFRYQDLLLRPVGRPVPEPGRGVSLTFAGVAHRRRAADDRDAGRSRAPRGPPQGLIASTADSAQSLRWRCARRQSPSLTVNRSPTASPRSRRCGTARSSHQPSTCWWSPGLQTRSVSSRSAALPCAEPTRSLREPTSQRELATVHDARLGGARFELRLPRSPQ